MCIPRRMYWFVDETVGIVMNGLFGFPTKFQGGFAMDRHPRHDGRAHLPHSSSVKQTRQN